MNLLIVKRGHGKSSRHGSSGPLHVHLFSGPDNVEWSIIRRTSPVAKTFHVDGITTLPTLQTSLAFLVVMCVPLLRKTQVLPAADGPPKVAESTKKTSFCVTLLHTTLVRESTSPRDHWSPVLLLMYGSPLVRVTQVG